MGCSLPGPDNLHFVSRQELTLANRLVRAERIVEEAICLLPNLTGESSL